MDTQGESGTSKLLVFIIGLAIGLLLAAAIAFVKAELDSRSGDSKVTTETAGILLSISSPSQGDITSDKTVTVKGSTGKDAVVAITGGAEDQIGETKEGKFSIEINLVEGENEITVYAFDAGTGEAVQDTLSLLYLKENLASLNMLIASSHKNLAEKKSDKIESLKENLATKSSKQKSSGSIYKRSHVFGTITSIDEQTIMMETKKGDVKTIFTDEFTKFFSIGTKGKSSITLEDLAIGEAISAVGVGKDDTGGNAKFIIRQKKGVSKRHAVLGKVKETSGNTLTITHLTHTDREFTITIEGGTRIKIKGDENATVSDIKKDDIVVATGNVDKNGTLTAKKIFLIPGKREGIKAKESTKSATPSSGQ
jgi:hypothetical protein